MGEGWLPRVTRTAARRADAVIAPWPALSRELDGEVDHTVVPWGLDTDLFRPIDRAEARERVGWPADERIVLFPYDPDRPVKDYPLAERTVSRLSTDAELRVVTGVPYEEMPYYLNASDALLVTSERESGPMVVREAAACNVPVVSTDVGAAADVLGDVENAHVAGDEEALVAALEAVLDDGGRADGRSTLDDLGVDRMGERLLSVYDEIR
jgi:glycosyltransferase involved in cell wall biosynthesis